jgi:1-aminocyclopropane-1-carboxylate deaminase
MHNLLIQPPIESLQKWNSQKVDSVDVLRLDKIHPIVSGNKWYKLKYYLKDAQKNSCKTIVTFGGAYSNHIVATAFACSKLGFKSIGIIRGEKPLKLSHTLQDAEIYGMHLEYVSREEYRDKLSISDKYQSQEYYVIPEGGCGELGVKGAAEILSTVVNLEKYTHIICSCGTGTMATGIIASASENQNVIGINVLKGYSQLKQDIIALLPSNKKNKEFDIINDYHFGGYAKYSDELIKWMNNFWVKCNMPTDFVYSSKIFFAINDMIEHNYFKVSDKLLVIHCGGLQGNLSLPSGTLEF